jgi:hypothetical protein
MFHIADRSLVPYPLLSHHRLRQMTFLLRADRPPSAFFPNAVNSNSRSEAANVSSRDHCHGAADRTEKDSQ